MAIYITKDGKQVTTPIRYEGTYTLDVNMSCDGCANAITRILKKIDGVQDVQCNVPDHRVVVKTLRYDDSLSAEDILKALEPWAAASNKTCKLQSETKTAC